MVVVPLDRHIDAPTDERSWKQPPRPSPLLDLDPELGAMLNSQRFAAARTELVVRSLRLSRGGWAAEELRSASPDHFGLLVIDGAIAREVLLEDSISTELLGPGDLIRPWSPDGGAELLGQEVRWQVLADARLALLDRRFATAVGHFAEVNTALLGRLNTRLERISTMKAISQLTSVGRRLIALFWHLAERWGRVTPDGILVPLTLSHRLLGELVGARRPTVTTALAGLVAEGQLIRRADAAWLLRGEPVGAPSATLSRAISHRRRLLTELPTGALRAERVSRG